MFEWLTELVGGTPITYGIVLAAVAADAFFPVVPGETIVITSAVLAADGDLTIWLIFAAAGAGAMIGDCISYVLGKCVGDPAAERIFKGARSTRLLDWADRQIRERGSGLIVAARFVPGGRTAATFAAGMLGMSARRFVLADAVAAAVWSLYASLLGYLGGTAFAESLWKPLAVALGVAAVVSVLGEVVRRRQLDGGEEEPDEHGHDAEPRREGPPYVRSRGRTCIAPTPRRRGDARMENRDARRAAARGRRPGLPGSSFPLGRVRVVPLCESETDTSRLPGHLGGRPRSR